jgi:hypothetical protein
MTSHSEIFDACALINLYASSFMGEIISSRQARCYVVEQASQESLFIRRPSDTGTSFDKEPVVLAPYFNSGALQSVKLETEDEQNLFVNLALQIDDGEAATIAIAISRQMQVITDDKKAIRILKQEAPGIDCLSTLEVVKAWSEMLSVKPEQIKAALSNILKYANYRPGKGHPLFTWWQSIMNS